MRYLIKDWWYELETIFRFQISIGLRSFSFEISLLGFDFEISLFAPYYLSRANYFGAWHKQVSKNIYFEAESMFLHEMATKIEINWTMHRSHSGVNVDVSLLGFQQGFRFYDTRHWDYNKNCFEEVENGTI